MTGLKGFRIHNDNTPNIRSHAPKVSSLTPLTALTDKHLGKDSWHLLPHLQILDIYFFPSPIQDVQFPSTLRALGLYTGNPNTLGHDGLSTISRLTGLKRLDLHGRIVAIPPLAKLTSLSLFMSQEDCIPTLTGYPLLHTLRLQLCKDLLLPALEGLPRLSHICYSQRLEFDDGCKVQWHVHISALHRVQAIS